MTAQHAPSTSLAARRSEGADPPVRRRPALARPGAGRLARRAGAVALGLTLLAVPALATPANPNDTYFSSQWALKVIRAPQAWERSTGAGSVVAVVDTGVQFGIPDLPQSKSAGSYNCIGSAGNSAPCPADTSGDDQGHGTWVASIIAAQTNNGVGMAAVAPDARILSIKAIGPDGTGSVDDIAKGIEFAADEGANVINLSVGPDAFGQSFPTFDCPPTTVGGCLNSPVNDSASLQKAMQPAIDYASSHGALVVLAAGNTNPGYSGPSLYLGLHNVLIVGATGPHDEVASYSDTGSGPTFIWAPGGDGACASSDTSNCIILASKAGSYEVSEGTSFATPHVAGVAALLMAVGYSNSSAADRIESTADPISAGVRLDAAAALGASPLLPASGPPSVAPAVQSSPQTVVRTSPQPVVRTSPVPTPAKPAPSATPPPSPSPTPAPQPSLQAAGGTTPTPPSGAALRALSSRSRSGSHPVEAIALVAVLAAAGGSGAVWLSRRVRV